VFGEGNARENPLGVTSKKIEKQQASSMAQLATLIFASVKTVMARYRRRFALFCLGMAGLSRSCLRSPDYSHLQTDSWARHPQPHTAHCNIFSQLRTCREQLG